MFKPTMIALAATLALSAAPAGAGLPSYNALTSNALTSNALTGNGLDSSNTVVANGLDSSNTVVANGLGTYNTVRDNASARTELHLVGTTGAPVATGRVIVFRLVAIEPAPK